MSERGVFAVDRGVFDHPLLKGEPFTRVQAFMWLISEAAWKGHRKAIGSRVVQVERGQTAHSLRFMADAWDWSEPKVRRFLARLKTDAMIDARTDAGVTIITLCNYDRYQRVSLPTDAVTLPDTDAHATQDRRRLEDREYKEIGSLSETSSDAFSAEAAKPNDDTQSAEPRPRKRIVYPAEYEALWLAFPTDRLMSKSEGFKAWQRLDADDRALCALAAPHFAAYCKRHPDYRPIHLERFITKRRFEGFAMPTVTAANASAKPRTPKGDSAARMFVRDWLKNPHSWPAKYGPTPDKPDCRVPAEILAEFSELKRQPPALRCVGGTDADLFPADRLRSEREGRAA